MRVWSIFIESAIANFCAFGFFQLNLSVKEYKEKYEQIKNKLAGARDNEGSLHYTNSKELEFLLIKGECNAWELFTNKKIEIKKEKLHPSARYRIIRYLKAKLGRELSLMTYINEMKESN